MRVITRAGFGRDLKKIRDQKLVARVRDCLDSAASATSIGEMTHIQPIVDHENYYRVRIGDYRIGLYLNGDALEFVRVLPRRDFYRAFP